MPLIDARSSCLLVIDLQAKLMPAISGGAEVVETTNRMIRVAETMALPVLFTEQNPRGLGETVEQVETRAPKQVVEKMTFNACGADALAEAIGDCRQVVVAGCEAHVCVLQTVLGLLTAGRQVFVLEDAVGSRDPVNQARALTRMAANGAEIVMSEMAIFEWLGSAENPSFKAVLGIVKEA